MYRILEIDKEGNERFLDGEFFTIEEIEIELEIHYKEDCEYKVLPGEVLECMVILV